MENQISKYKGCFYPSENDWDKDEEVMAVICHNGETYSPIQVNRKDDKYFKQLHHLRDGQASCLYLRK